jgi:thiamine-monophosphate kinase
MSEQDFVSWLRSTVSVADDDIVPLGDDAAVLNWARRDNLVVTSDLLAEGTHFCLAEHGPTRVARKALAVNLSDLAAMGARPVAAVVSLLLPRQGAQLLAEELLRDMALFAQAYSMRIVGGDTNSWSGGLVINVTAFGALTPAGPLRRDGARLGDILLVTGELGGSRLGKHLDFEPRVNEALKLIQHYRLSAGMDISDGLLLDLARLTSASGCGAVLEADAIPISAAASAWGVQSGSGQSALDHALSDGEDFELLLAAPPDEADRLLRDQPLEIPITKIGVCVAEPGLWMDHASHRTPVSPRGFDHLG